MAAIGTVFGGRNASAQIAVSDNDLLNFILQLKYLEAEFAARGVTGNGLPNSLISGTGRLGVVNGGTLVPFVNVTLFEVAADIYTNDVTQLGYLRSLLGAAVTARPLIDLAGGFQLQAENAKTSAGAQFNPFTNEVNFFLAAFSLKEVILTAIAGVIPLLSTPANVSVVASALAVESYHAGAVRAVLTQIASGAAVPADLPSATTLPFDTEAIADLQSRLTGSVTGVGIINPATGTYQISTRDSNALAYRRTPAQVLRVVTFGNEPTGSVFDAIDFSTALPNNFGGFFPGGVNGTIHTQATAP